jgi:heat shock protein HtpX
MNSLKVLFLLLLMTLLFMGVGYLLGGQTGMIIAFAFAAIFNFASYWYSDKVVLKMYKARQITEADHRRLYSIVRSVSQKAMISMPKVYIIPTKAPNAFATGRNSSHAAVAATEGLLELLDDRELEGVIGHEISHVLNRDMLISTIAATLAGAIGLIAAMARWAFIFGGFGGGRNERSNPFALIIAMIVAPIAAMMIQMGISRAREYKADARGAEITSQYLGLASALKKIHRAPNRMLTAERHPETAQLFISNPLSGKGITALFSTHPPIEKRIKRLEDLATRRVYR